MAKMAAKGMQRIEDTKEKMKTTELIIVLMENNSDAPDFHNNVVTN